MARQTRPPPSSGLPGRLPGLGHDRTSAYDLHGDPRIGAAEAAPTAPHATAPTERDRSGPAKFWSTRRIRIALAITLAFSAILHMSVSPWQLFPDMSAFKAKDVDGELSIPIDLLDDEAPKPDEPSSFQESANPTPTGTTMNRPDAAPPKLKPDASADAEALGIEAGPALTDRDGGPSDAGEDALADGGMIALVTEAGTGVGGPSDPASMVGLAASTTVNTGPQNVVLAVNVATIAKHPYSPRIGGIMQVIPQWREFLRGSSQAAQIDPMKETQWILIYGPSLRDTDRDAVLVRYTASDAVVDAVIDGIAKRAQADPGKRGPKGEIPGPYDAGVPGIPATLGHADNGMRVFMRPQPKLLVIVPPSHANAAAQAYKGKAPRGPDAAEALRLIVRNPSQQVSIKGVHFDQHLQKITLVIRPDAQNGADLDAVGECDDDASAQVVADDMKKLIKGFNTGLVKAMTKGLLDNIVIDNPGNKKVTLHLHMTEQDLDVAITYAEAFTGANPPP